MKILIGIGIVFLALMFILAWVFSSLPSKKSIKAKTPKAIRVAKKIGKKF